MCASSAVFVRAHNEPIQRGAVNHLQQRHSSMRLPGNAQSLRRVLLLGVVMQLNTAGRLRLHY